MNLARSTYHYSPRGRRRADEGALTARIEAIREEFPRYGYRRVTANRHPADARGAARSVG